jgi:hypothetical protein
MQPKMIPAGAKVTGKQLSAISFQQSAAPV